MAEKLFLILLMKLNFFIFYVPTNSYSWFGPHFGIFMGFGAKMDYWVGVTFKNYFLGIWKLFWGLLIQLKDLYFFNWHSILPLNVDWNCCHFWFFLKSNWANFLLLRLGSTTVLGSTDITGQLFYMVPTIWIFIFDLILEWYLAFGGPHRLTPFLNIALFLLYYTVVTLREEWRLTLRIIW